MKRSPLWLVGVAASMLLACSASSGVADAGAARAPCIDIGNGISRHGEIVAAGAQARVAPGAIVFVVLVEFAFNTAGHRYPSVFPWLTASSSDPHVLTPVPICREKGSVSTLPLSVAAFRAMRPGRATLSAPLQAAWRAVPKEPFRAYRAVVVVAPGGAPST